MSWLKRLLALLIVAGFFWYLWEHRTDLLKTLDASPWQMLGIVALIFGGWLAAGLQAATLYRALRLPLRVTESVLLTAAGGFGNYMPMRAGTLVRALYLKEVHGLAFARFGGVTGLRTLLTLIAAGAAGLLGIAMIALRDGGRGSLGLTLLFLVLVVAPMLLMLLPVPTWPGASGRIRRMAHNFSGAYDTLRRQPLVGLGVVLLALAQYLLIGLRFVISGAAVGADMDLLVVMMMAPLAALMQFVSITPGGIGLREAVMGYVSMSLGYSFAEGVYIGAVDRAMLLAVTGLFGGASFARLWHLIGRKQRERARRVGAEATVDSLRGSGK